MIERERLTRYMDVIYHRCCRILRDPDLAKDALQEIFLSFYQRLQDTPIEKPLHYLYKSSTHHCLNLLRASKRRLCLPPPPSDDGFLPSPDAGLVVEDLHQTFGQDALQLLIYRFLDHMTYDEIAAIFDLSDRAIKKRLDRLQEKVLQHLQRETL